MKKKQASTQPKSSSGLEGIQFPNDASDRRPILEESEDDDADGVEEVYEDDDDVEVQLGGSKGVSQGNEEEEISAKDIEKEIVQLQAQVRLCWDFQEWSSNSF